jgi:hypothetical protein
MSSILHADYSRAFDTKTALTSLYLWLLFGFLSSIVSCDFKRWIHDNIWFRHIVGIVAFFFLFTVIDVSNDIPIGIVWLKTIIVYILFLLMVKSKWYFSVPLLVLLIIDQSIKSHHSYTQNKNKSDPALPTYNKWRNYLSYMIYAIIVIGFISYGIRQRKEFGATFSWLKLVLHYGCKGR